MSAAPRRVPASALETFTARLFRSHGLPTADAETVARALVLADLRGVDSHGVLRVGVYVERLKRGLINPAPKVRVLRETPGAALLDGDNGMGPVVATAAMRLALEKARATGTGTVAVRRGNHYGMAAAYPLMALEENCIGLTVTNGPALVAPWGGTRRFFGTNPLAIAVPAGRERPVVLDMATTVVARGKIIKAAKEQQPIPAGWALDVAGSPTTDAAAALAGTPVPLGGYKGSGLMLLIEVLSGVLAGAAVGPAVGELYDNPRRPQDVGHLFAALRLTAFGDPEAFKARMDAMIQEVRSGPAAPGTERIYLPGEIEFETEARHRREGVPIGPALWEELTVLGREVGLPLPGEA
ncbi:MAG TPA: Ldh family oxidoreductase [Candidatus Methylomirabilis sp.]|nr:Ldh family oxidoreductase [Candidatus Methylomirabilis sp.]